MRIERARPGDRSQIERINHDLFHPGSEPLRWTDTFWVVHNSGRVVGFASARVLPCDCVYLSRCAVLREARGHGLQRRLIRARLRLATLPAVTYTIENVRSANNLIACGFRLFVPARAWAGTDALYWARWAKT